MISDPSSGADCDDSARRQSVESSARLPLFCDEKETKRIVEENQCPEYNKSVDQGQDNKVSGASRDSSGAATAGAKRVATRAGASSPVSTGMTTKQKLRLQAGQQSADGIDYPKPRKVPSMKADHQARTNKAYDLRYEYTRKGATIPSTMMDHLDNYNKPLFLRFWKGNRCFEYANDRVQPLIKQEMKRRRSSGGSFKSTKAPKRDYRDSYAKRRKSVGIAPGSTSRSPSTESSSTRGNTGSGGSTSPKSRASGYTTGTGSSPSAIGSSQASGYTTGGRSSAKGGSSSTQARSGGTGTSKGIQDNRSTSPQKNLKKSAGKHSADPSKNVYTTVWW